MHLSALDGGVEKSGVHGGFVHALGGGRSTGGADTLSSSKVAREEVTRMSRIAALIMRLDIYLLYLWEVVSRFCDLNRNDQLFIFLKASFSLSASTFLN